MSSDIYKKIISSGPYQLPNGELLYIQDLLPLPSAEAATEFNPVHRENRSRLENNRQIYYTTKDKDDKIITYRLKFNLTTGVLKYIYYSNPHPDFLVNGCYLQEMQDICNAAGEVLSETNLLTFTEDDINELFTQGRLSNPIYAHDEYGMLHEILVSYDPIMKIVDFAESKYVQCILDRFTHLESAPYLYNINLAKESKAYPQYITNKIQFVLTQRQKEQLSHGEMISVNIWEYNATGGIIKHLNVPVCYHASEGLLFSNECMGNMPNKEHCKTLYEDLQYVLTAINKKNNNQHQIKL